MRTAMQHHSKRLREKFAENEAAARRYQLLQDRSFLPMRQEGMRACLEGKLRADNPYLEDTGPWVHWDAGFRDARNAEG